MKCIKCKIGKPTLKSALTKKIRARSKRSKNVSRKKYVQKYVQFNVQGRHETTRKYKRRRLINTRRYNKSLTKNTPTVQDVRKKLEREAFHILMQKRLQQRKNKKTNKTNLPRKLIFLNNVPTLQNNFTTLSRKQNESELPYLQRTEEKKKSVQQKQTSRMDVLKQIRRTDLPALANFVERSTRAGQMATDAIIDRVSREIATPTLAMFRKFTTFNKKD